ncbi:MAG: POTRA domain-containing protein, partial [Bacillota bacterium]
MLRNTLVHGRRGLGLAMAFVLCSGLPVSAAVTPDVEHALQTAGQVQDSVKNRDLVVPPKANVQIEVTEEQPEGEPSKEGFKFPVKGFQFSGIGTVNELALREDKLQALVKDAAGQELTLSELKAVARRVTKYFHAQGYMVARAYIPAQKLEDGIITIAVLPGKYGAIELRNHSRLSDRLARKMLADLDPGSYVKRSELERTLLLISDTGGISIKANLKPGDATGTSTLVVDIENTEALTADLSMNNYGNRYTGKDLRSFNLDAHNVSGKGDQLGFHVDNSGGGLTNFGLDYIVPLGGKGLKLGIGYEQLRY